MGVRRELIGERARRLSPALGLQGPLDALEPVDHSVKPLDHLVMVIDMGRARGGLGIGIRVPAPPHILAISALGGHARIAHGIGRRIAVIAGVVSVVGFAAIGGRGGISTISLRAPEGVLFRRPAMSGVRHRVVTIGGRQGRQFRRLRRSRAIGAGSWRQIRRLRHRLERRLCSTAFRAGRQRVLLSNQHRRHEGHEQCRQQAREMIRHGGSPETAMRAHSLPPVGFSA